MAIAFPRRIAGPSLPTSAPCNSADGPPWGTLRMRSAGDWRRSDADHARRRLWGPGSGPFGNPGLRGRAFLRLHPGSALLAVRLRLLVGAGPGMPGLPDAA